MSTFEAFKTRVRQSVERCLEEILSAQDDTEVCRTAKYGVLGGGHRWRAMVAIAAGSIFDRDAMTICRSLACGVEMAHGASLILDDLPSMDDADYRRGRPSAHLVYPAWAVHLAPMYLINTAYRAVLDNQSVAPERRLTGAIEMSNAAILMIEGQEIDLSQPSSGDEQTMMLKCYRRKSGALYASAARVGATFCGASEDDSAAVYGACMNLGLSYQYLDDVADVEAGLGEVGKLPGNDVGKRTAIHFFGVTDTKIQAQRYQEIALSYLDRFGPEAEILRNLARHASWSPI
ncbi:MAG: polyprenyl synthetase family protein [Anaerolineales bacterium]|jgi:geranylgeranyl pyrophosphate synthase|nr:polyprenyl synthetase family protein [Anaerolineales bacterium]|tara:strand:+ start:253 stop:1122 length:870 start_codon:yes stop_codon:yes gene_type:complete